MDGYACMCKREAFAQGPLTLGLGRGTAYRKPKCPSLLRLLHETPEGYGQTVLIILNEVSQWSDMYGSCMCI